MATKVEKSFRDIGNNLRTLLEMKVQEFISDPSKDLQVDTLRYMISMFKTLIDSDPDMRKKGVFKGERDKMDEAEAKKVKEGAAKKLDELMEFFND